MTRHLHRRISESLYRELRNLEKKYKFETILKSGVEFYKLKDSFEKEFVEYAKKIEYFIRKIEEGNANIRTNMDKSTFILDGIREILVGLKDLKEEFKKIIEKFNEHLYLECKKLIHLYKNLHFAYREDTGKLLEILSRYLDSDKMKKIVVGINRRIREYDVF